jgi:hypothetical protein
MYVMFSTPLIASSKDGVTERNMVSAFAPGYTAVTNTEGGAIFGNRSSGSFVKLSTPTITNSMEITVDNTGLSMNFLNMANKFYVYLFLNRRGLLVIGFLRMDDHSFLKVVDAADYDLITGFHSLIYQVVIT